MVETDGPYGGGLCSATNHTHHHGVLDSQYWQARQPAPCQAPANHARRTAGISILKASASAHQNRPIPEYYQNPGEICGPRGGMAHEQRAQAQGASLHGTARLPRRACRPNSIKRCVALGSSSTRQTSTSRPGRTR